ncbi:Armadillo-type fold [Heracleum sosnowskyi]|uniref:Armadillo-type fold n=1 Tax=Heracleum sosnowskyi TaxID=360622 RepID=A0AAD8M5F7_9APIA|nr:Armadillo-type fold [Heracleum sosnowskyi]
MSSCSGLGLEKELKEVGIKLLGLVSLDTALVEDLLNSLDQVDGLLSKVEQAPSRSMQDALYPSMKALISDQLLKHFDIDVKVSVASCMSELTRITAPDAPYDDVQMKEIFQLTVVALGMLSSEDTRGYSKALHILENISKVRACLLMLDLECDQLIANMFELFLSTIRYIHLPVVFRQMEYIMTLTIEESEEISEELLSILLSSVSKKKADQNTFSRPWRLGEKVLRNCAIELQRFLPKVFRLRNLNLDDFSDIVASICQNSPEDEHKVAEVAEPSSIIQSRITISDGFGPEKTNGILRGTNSLKTLKPEHTQAGRHSQTENSDVTGILQEKAVTAPKKRGRKPNSQHGHTDGSQPTKLRRKKDSTVFNPCHEVTKTGTRTNHAPADIVVKKESDDSEQYFEQDSRMTHGINEKLVGRKVKVWWPLDKKFYEGAVASFDSLTQMHKVLYADGDEETLNLRMERWELLEEQATPAASDKSPKKKKAKTGSASLIKPGTISSGKGPRIADKSKTEAPKSGSCADNFAPYAVCIADVTKDDINTVDFTLKDDKQKSTGDADISKPDVLRIADVATNGITVNPNPTDDKHKLISKKETKTLMTTTKPKLRPVVELGSESATHSTIIVKDKSSCEKISEDVGMLPDTVNAQGSDSSSAKKRQRLVNGEGVAP